MPTQSNLEHFCFKVARPPRILLEDKDVAFHRSRTSAGGSVKSPVAKSHSQSTTTNATTIARGQPHVSADSKGGHGDAASAGNLNDAPTHVNGKAYDDNRSDVRISARRHASRDHKSSLSSPSHSVDHESNDSAKQDQGQLRSSSPTSQVSRARDASLKRKRGSTEPIGSLFRDNVEATGQETKASSSRVGFSNGIPMNPVSPTGSKSRGQSMPASSAQSKSSGLSVASRTPSPPCTDDRLESTTVRDEISREPPSSAAGKSSVLSIASKTPSFPSTNTSVESTIISSSAAQKQSFVRSSQSDENEEYMHEVDDEGVQIYHSDLSDVDSIDELLGTQHKTAEPKRPTRQVATLSNSGSHESKARNALEEFKSNFRRREKRFVMPRTRNYTHSLDSLIKHEQKNASAQEMVDKAVGLADAESDMAMQKTQGIEKTLAASVKEEDRDEVMHKMMRVMNAAQALKSEMVWHFFDDTKSVEDVGRVRFPTSAIKNHDELHILKKDRQRQEAFLTGFASDLMHGSEAPLAFLEWLLNAALYEEREDLAESYMTTIQTHKKLFEHVWTEARLRDFLGSLGAHEESLDPSQYLQLRQRLRDAPKHEVPMALSRLIRLMKFTASFSIPDLKYAITILIRLGMDKEVIANSPLRVNIQQVLELLYQNFMQQAPREVKDGFIEQLWASAEPRNLQEDLLAIIPNASLPLRMIKRRLALAFFFDDSSLLREDLQRNLALTKRVVDHLRTDQRFRMRDSTVDFQELATSISLLDIGIAGGFGPMTERATEAESKEAIKTFNAQVDLLSDQVERLFISILDGGAGHIERTAAKAVLERLLKRLECSVRTKPRPKTDIIMETLESRGIEADSNKVKFMERFLKPRQLMETST